MLRYTSLQSYKLLLKEFHLPSISFLRKIKQGHIDITQVRGVVSDNHASNVAAYKKLQAAH